MIFATSGGQAIALGIVLALLFGWAVYLLFNYFKPTRRPGSEIEDAPNRRPYLSDDELEGPKLDSALRWGLVVLTLVAIGLPLYWLKEPHRQERATTGFDRRSVERGAELFQSAQAKLEPGHIAAGCADCHGAKGQGGSTQFTITRKVNGKDTVIPVTWQVPALDTVLYRFSPDEVREILVYGRPPTPMPAWGVVGGGALGDQQIDDLVNFLISIQLKQKDATAQSAKSGTDGKALFDQYCARCHTLGWSYKESYQEPSAVDGGGAFGPNLTNGTTTRQFPQRQDHIDFITNGSDFEKNYGVRGIGSGRMPGFGPDENAKTALDAPHCNFSDPNLQPRKCTTFRLGGMLSEEQIKAIVDYERSL